MGISYNTSTVKSGLMLHLDAANVKSYSGTGTAWNDMSGNGYNGTLVNSVGYNTDNKGTMIFDGIDDCVPFNNNILVNTIGPFTVYIWMNHNSRTSGTLFHRMATLRSSATEPLGIAYVNGTNSGYSGLYLTSASGWVKGSNGYFPTANIWGLLTVTYNGNGSTTGSNFKMYWNSVDIGFTANPSAGAVSITNSSVLGGRRTTTDDQFYKGKMSTFSLYNTEHNINQISQNFEALRGRYGI